MSDMYTDRPPKRLDEKLVQAAVTIASAGLAAYWNVAFGGRTPANDNYYQRATNPRPGDLVVERSSFAIRVARDQWPEICLGTLFETKSEWVLYEMSKEDKVGLDPDELGHRDTATYIQLWVSPAPAELTRWTNCDFIAIPRTPTETRAWETAAS